MTKTNLRIYGGLPESGLIAPEDCCDLLQGAAGAHVAVQKGCHGGVDMHEHVQEPHVGEHHAESHNNDL